MKKTVNKLKELYKDFPDQFMDLIERAKKSAGVKNHPLKLNGIELAIFANYFKSKGEPLGIVYDLLHIPQRTFNDKLKKEGISTGGNRKGLYIIPDNHERIEINNIETEMNNDVSPVSSASPVSSVSSVYKYKETSKTSPKTWSSLANTLKLKKKLKLKVDDKEAWFKTHSKPVYKETGTDTEKDPDQYNEQEKQAELALNTKENVNDTFTNIGVSTRSNNTIIKGGGQTVDDMVRSIITRVETLEKKGSTSMSLYNTSVPVMDYDPVNMASDPVNPVNPVNMVSDRTSMTYRQFDERFEPFNTDLIPPNTDYFPVNTFDPQDKIKHRLVTPYYKSYSDHYRTWDHVRRTFGANRKLVHIFTHVTAWEGFQQGHTISQAIFDFIFTRVNRVHLKRYFDEVAKRGPDFNCEVDFDDLKACKKNIMTKELKIRSKNEGKEKKELKKKLKELKAIKAKIEKQDKPD